MIKRLIIVLAALVLVFGVIFGVKLMAIKRMASRGGPPPAAVSVTHVTAEKWESYLQAVGGLVASQGVMVTNELEGKVQAINFQSGQAVTQGHTLVQLDDSVDRAQLQGLDAQERLARIRFDRDKRLLKTKAVSRSDYDQSRANLQNAAAAVAAQKARIAQKRIAAPFSGLLGIRQVDLGQFLAKGAQIVSLQRLNPIYADFALPERELAQVAVGQEVQLQVPAYPGRVFTGHVSAVEPRINTNTRNGQVRATVPNADDLLRPGMSADVRLLLGRERTVLTLPRNAVTYNPYGDMVYLIERKSGQLIARSSQVQTGGTRNGRVEITKGLQAGAEVVGAGQVKLRSGEPVRINNSVTLNQPATGP